MLPMCAPIFGSLRHSSSSISLIRSKEVTRVNTLEVIRKAVQEPCHGKGKRALTRVSKLLSVGQNHSATLPNDRDGISVMVFSFPGVLTGLMGHVPLSFILNANARTNCAATRECHDAMCRTQLTVGSLSLKTATRRSLSSPHTSSITKNNRSKLVIFPFGLLNKTREFLLSDGHSILVPD